MLLAAVFPVNSTKDLDDANLADGICDTGSSIPIAGRPECTLRAAIQQGNQASDKDRIEFDIPTADPGYNSATDSFVLRISKNLVPLPAIINPVVIDGYSQPGATPNTLADGDNAVLKIELDGTLFANLKAHGLLIATTGSEIRGLVINRFGQTLITLEGGGGHKIEGNFLGTDVTGTQDFGAKIYGIDVHDSAGNVVGGTVPAARNLVSGNDFNGIVIANSASVGNQVQGNFIGTNRTGTAALGNGRDGVLITAKLGTSDYPTNNTIGGSTYAARNIISGNGDAGVEIYGGSLNRVQGNYIGVDVTGENDLGNRFEGVVLLGTNTISNILGGRNLGEGNVISGNDQNGIKISKGASGNLVQGNRIGTDEDGEITLPNGKNGITIDESPNNTIGGTDEEARNVISGNNRGVLITGVGAILNHVLGNYIGLNSAGTASLGNTTEGVRIDGAAVNVIGGSGSGARNVVSGNFLGVAITGASAIGNSVQGNYIGTDYLGAGDLGNREDGVFISSPNNIIGGTVAGAGNVISGNDEIGISIVGSDANNNRVQGNLIGTDVTGIKKLSNGQHGVFLDKSASDNSLSDNTIAFNGTSLGARGYGVVVTSGARNAMRRNRIYGNAGRGIDLENAAQPDTFTLNDPLDTDDGANGLQDYPVMVSNFQVGSTRQVSWTFNSAANATFIIEFFANSEPDPSGFGPGEKILFGLSVTTDNKGDADFQTTFSASDLFISATATDDKNNTSEFSMVDTDGDALADTWETRGIDLDENGTVDFQLPGAPDPKHKDLYIEVDAMSGLAPTQADLDEVAVAFDIAPVHNPDNFSGIVLHALLDETTMARQAWTGDFDGDGTDALGGDQNANGVVDPGEATKSNGDLVPGDRDDQLGWPFFNQVKQNGIGGVGGFGTPAQRANPVELAAKRLAFRYAIFADRFVVSRPGGGADVGTSGIAEIQIRADTLISVGNDFMVTLGTWANTSGQRSGTFMHELGHTLGLRHGGGDGVNNKPNYHSVMNYVWQTPDFSWMYEDPNFNGVRDFDDLNGDGIQDPGEFFIELDYNRNGAYNDSTWELDYSDRKFNTLIENGGLDENPGIGGHAGHWTPVGPIPHAFVLESGPVDWSRGDADGDGDFLNDTFVSADVNRDGISGQTLDGHNDWSNLRFSFLESAHFAEGASMETPVVDMTLDEFEELNSIGPGPGILEFRLDKQEVNEDAGTATITVTRAGGTFRAVTVVYATSDGTANDGDDYTGVSGTLAFLEGEFVKTFTISLVTDFDDEDAETVILTLTHPTAGATLGLRDTATLSIADKKSPGRFMFGQAQTVVNEGGGAVNITIVRTHGSYGSAQVTFATLDGTAQAGSDYVAKSQTVLFAAGQKEATVSVSITNDMVLEHTETIGLTLINPTGGATLGSQSFAQINVVDNEGPIGNFVVATTANAGPGSLRQAILDANVNSDHNLITFDIPSGGVQVIRPITALPFISWPATIDGYTQPGTSPNTLAADNNSVILITLDGTSLSGGHGLEIRAGGSTVRGLSIHSFPGSGIDLRIGQGNFVDGNFIGVGPAGTIFRGNNADGVSITGSNDNRIGSANPASRNVISGNRSSGVGIHSSNSLRTIIQGNYIGTAANGIDPFPNGEDGVQSLGHGTLIGGRLPAEGNLIAFNAANGIDALFNGDDVPAILSNSIHSNNPSERNNFKGIQIVQTDTAHNFPALSSALNVNGQGQIAGRMKGSPNIELLIQFFSNPAVDLSGHGEGKTLLGSTSVRTDANGNVNFTAVLDQPLTLGEFITSTVTDISQGHTSEFSARLPVGSSLTSDVYVVNTTSDADDGFCDSVHCSLREAIFAANNHPGKDRIEFAIAPGGVQTIAPGPAPLPAVTEPTVIDATTQLGYSSTPIIELSGQNVVTQVHNHNTGLWIIGGESEVRGLVINRFQNGIVLGANSFATPPESLGGNFIQNNYVGTDVSGTVKQGNGFGILMANSPNNLIGGGTPGARNLVSGNSVSGIRVMSHTVFNSTVFVEQYAENNRIEGNYVGTDATGTMALGNGTGFNGDGIVAAGPGTVVKNNLVSANVVGILVWPPLEGAPIRIIGNFVGTDVSGTRNLGNNSQGIGFFSGAATLGPRPAVIVGGSLASERNIISGNGSGPFNGAGIAFGGNSPMAVLGNYIGTDVTGTVAIPNANGVDILGSSHIVENNLISGNLGYGVRLSGRLTLNNTVAGNLIGTQADGVNPLGNGDDGVVIRQGNVTFPTESGTHGNTIGGPGAGQGNVIAFNAGHGISAGNFTLRNAFLSNRIYSNGGLGIELGRDGGLGKPFVSDGSTSNDIGDTDDGPNLTQNFPIVVSAESGTGITRVTTAFRGAPSTSIRVQFFWGGTDPLGYGEGRSYLGTTTTTTNSNGIASFVITFAGEVPVGEFVTAIADQAGNTSEFSEATAVRPLPLQDGGADVGSQAAFDSVQPAPPLVVAQTRGPYAGTEGATITLIGSNSFAVGGTIVLYEWDLDNDGQFDDATGDNANVIFADNGTFTVDLRVTDNTGHSDTDTLKATVNNANPVVNAGPNATVVLGDTFVATGSFIDPGADTWSATVDYGDGAGAQPLVLDSNKALALNHKYAASGSYTITVTVTDDDAGTGTGVVLVSVPNTAPAAVSDAYEVNEDSVLTVDAPGVLGNDSDVEGNSLTAVLIGEPLHGDLGLNADGSFVYQPDPDYFGMDRFTYVANDRIANSIAVTVSITINGVNDAPVANDDFLWLEEDYPNYSNVLNNDIEADGDPLTAVLLNGPTHGMLEFYPDGTVIYAPHADYFGIDSFTYQFSDGTSTSNVATVAVNIDSIDDPPVARDDEYIVSTNSVLTVAAINGLLANDYDVDSDVFEAEVFTYPAYGSLSWDSDGSFTYAPGSDFEGTDSFGYVAYSQRSSNFAIVNITVTSVANAPPVAVADSFNAVEDVTLTVTTDSSVLANDTDGDPLTVQLISPPLHGTLTLDPDGTFRYVPGGDLHGTEIFSYRAFDGELYSEPATVTITVAEVNDAPIAGADTATVDEDSDVTINILANDSTGPLNECAQTLAVTAASALHGTVLINANGSLRYTPTADYNGPDTIRYTIRDNGQTDGITTPRTADGLVAVTVTPMDESSAIRGNNFTDLTGNGLTPDDTALAGVTIKLYRDANRNGVLDTKTDTYVASTITAANGGYTFPNFGNGTYFVNQPVSSNYVRTYPLLSDTQTAQVSAGTQAIGLDFANFQKCDKSAVKSYYYVINGTRKVNDLTGNVNEGDEVRVVFTIATNRSQFPLSLVSYKTPEDVFRAETASLQQIFSKDSGSFTGSGSLTVTVPQSFYQIDFVCGAAIDRFGPAKSNIFFSAQNRLFDADNGGTPSSLAGFVYRDDNNNGVKSGSEPGVSGVKVTLTGTNDLNQSVSRTVKTCSSGAYTFANLRPGTYKITATQPAKYKDGKDSVGTSGGEASNDVFSSIVLGSRVNGKNYNFGELKKN